MAVYPPGPPSGTFVAPVTVFPSGGDDTAALNTAFAAGGLVTLKPFATYKLTSNTGLTYDPTIAKVQGFGTKIDASAMTAGTALTIAGSASGSGGAFPRSSLGGWTGIELAGPGASSSVTGVAYAGANPGVTVDVPMSGSTVHDFEILVSEGSYAWSYVLSNLRIYNGTNGIDNTAATTVAGEGINYFSVKIAACTLALNYPNGGDHVFFGGSIDMNPTINSGGAVLNLVGPGEVNFFGTHVEYYPITTNPVTLSGTDAVFRHSGGVWTQDGALPTVSSIVTNGATWTITFDSAHGLAVGSNFSLVNFTPAGYNGTFSVASVTSSTIVVVNNATQPGAITTTGTGGAGSFSQYVLGSSGTNNLGFWEHVPMSGVQTSTMNFVSGGVQGTTAYVAFPVVTGTGSSKLSLPPWYPGALAVGGAVYYNTATPTIAAGGTVTFNPSLNPVIEYTVTTSSAFTLASSATPPTARSQDLMIVVFNNSGGAMGTISWPAAFDFGSLTWTSPANGARAWLTLRYVPSFAKYLVTAIGTA